MVGVTNYLISQLLDLQKELKDNEYKYNELIKEYEFMKNYIINGQKSNESAQTVAVKNVSMLKQLLRSIKHELLF